MARRSPVGQTPLLIEEPGRRAERGQDVDADRRQGAGPDLGRAQLRPQHQHQPDEAERDAERAPQRGALAEQRRRQKRGGDRLPGRDQRGHRSRQAGADRPPHAAEINRVKKDAADQRIDPLARRSGKGRPAGQRRSPAATDPPRPGDSTGKSGDRHSRPNSGRRSSRSTRSQRTAAARRGRTAESGATASGCVTEAVATRNCHANRRARDDRVGRRPIARISSAGGRFAPARGGRRIGPRAMAARGRKGRRTVRRRPQIHRTMRQILAIFVIDF